MSDKSFRVLLDLIDLHIESLKYVWMNVSPLELLTIADFKLSIIHKINLDKTDIKLYVRNGLLLDAERVTILREDDIVKVRSDWQYNSDKNPTENLAKKNRKSDRKRNQSENLLDTPLNAMKECLANNENSKMEKYLSDEMSHKKKKYKRSHCMSFENPHNQSIALEANNSYPRVKKKIDVKQKSLQKNQIDYLPVSDSFFSFNNSENTVQENKKDICNVDTNVEFSSSLKTNLSKDSFLDDECNAGGESRVKDQCDSNLKTVEELNRSNNNCPKKKRKRHRKRKSVIETATTDITDNTSNKSEFQSFINEADESVQRKHIIYSCSPSREQEVIELECENDKNMKNPCTGTFVVNESISNASVKSSNNHPKISTPAQSNFCKTPNWCLSLMQKTNIISPAKTVELNENKISSRNTKSIDKQCENPNIKEKQSEVCYTNLPSLNSRPEIGTCIAYKILELNEHYCPEASDYREGIIRSINDDGKMEIELLKHMIKPGRIGKFENLREDEIPLPEIKTYDTVNWTDLIGPKLLKCD